MTGTVEYQKQIQERFNRVGEVNPTRILSEDHLASSNVSAIPQWERRKPYTPDLPNFPKSAVDPNRLNRVLKFYYYVTPDDSEQTYNAVNIPPPSFTSLVEELVKTLTTTWDQTLPAVIHPDVTKAQEEFARKMKILRKQPPPTLEEVEAQFRASAEIRKKFADKQLC
jgi:hypothetical protein